MENCKNCGEPLEENRHPAAQLCLRTKCITDYQKQFKKKPKRKCWNCGFLLEKHELRENKYEKYHNGYLYCIIYKDSVLAKNMRIKEELYER